MKKLGLSLASLLLALLAAELLVRLADAAPEVAVIRKGRFQLSRNPKIGYEPVPNLDYAGQELSFWDYQGKSNRLGYRDVEHAAAKPPGVYRIVVLGDSIAAGLRVERYEDTFPAVLERLLRARGLNAEVINLSVSGYNTRQEVETLKDRGLRFDPDLVLLAYTLNDRERMDGDILRALLAEERSDGAVGAAHAHPLLVESALYRFLRFRALASRAPSEEEVRRREELISGDTVAESLRDLAGLSRREGFDVLVTVFPRLVRWYSRYGYRDHHEFVAGLARENGFRLLDLLRSFQACKAVASGPLGADNFHPTAHGHRCAAEAMAEEILASRRAAKD